MLLSSCDLNATDVLVIFENGMVVTCNCRGVLVPLLEGTGNELNCFTLEIDVTRDRNFALLYSKKFIVEDPANGIYSRQGISNRTY